MSTIRQTPSFWPLVMCRTEIDLRRFQLPERLRTITFRFVDPIWAWVDVASKQPALEMHWMPQRKIHPNHPHDEYYGEGVQFGTNFAEACRTCPVGTYPMLVQFHWDGAYAHGMHATPICVGVGNTNSLSSNTKYCIGYLPVLTDMGGQHENAATEIRHYIKQQCTAAILAVLENAARTGVRCEMPTVSGSSVPMLLIPRLISMNLDSKDARMYYGLRSKTCCSKCKRRKGRSAFRKASRQSGRAVQTLYNIVADDNNDDRYVRLAQEKLLRWGFHPGRKCTFLLSYETILYSPETIEKSVHGTFL